MIEWKKYPENEPEKAGMYLVTLEHKKEKYVSVLEYMEPYKYHDEEGEKFHGGYWPDYGLNLARNDVIAFADFPSPFLD